MTVSFNSASFALSFCRLGRLLTRLLGPAAFVLCVLLWSVATAKADSLVLRQYDGTLTTAAREPQILRRFRVTVADSSDAHFFIVDDTAADACPWPESFGECSSAPTSDPRRPRIDYRFDDAVYSLHLPPFEQIVPPAGQPEWTVGGFLFQADGGVNAEGILRAEAVGHRGRRHRIRLRAKDGLLLASESDVFMGRGEAFRLSLTLADESQLEEAEADRWLSAVQMLIRLQEALGRPADTQRQDLTSAQAEAAAVALPRIVESAAGTQLHPFVIRLARLARRQQDQAMRAKDQTQQFLGKPLRPFEVMTTQGTRLQSSELRGTPVILHFWSYKDQPLSEPYGQTGYLEYLRARQPSERPVQVVGLIENASIRSEERTVQQQALRSAARLGEFMNLEYPIAYDDGGLLAELGDLRDRGNALPLWVLLDGEGVIRHIHWGYYEIDRRVGLKALQTALQAL